MSLKLPVGPNDHAQGASDAPVTLLEYGDYQCPYCGQAYPIVKALQKQLGKKLRLVFHNFPLAQAHPYAMAAAEMAEAAALQGKFWEMHDRLYEHQDALDPDSLMEHARHLKLDVAKLKADIEGGKVMAKVKADFDSGVRSGVNGTPSFYINGAKFEGNWTDVDEFSEALEQVPG